MLPLLTVIALALPTAPASPGSQAGAGLAKTTPIALQLAKAKKLEKYILRVNPKTKKWAGELAKAILREAKRFKLDPALFAAIAFNESWFDINARGRSYEHGCWQLWFRADFLRPAWDRLRTVMQGLPKEYGDRDWDKLPKRLQIKATKNVAYSTFMAAFLARGHVNRRCKKKQTAFCYGHYNSGNRRPRRGYVAKLRKRAKRIRKIFSR